MEEKKSKDKIIIVVLIVIIFAIVGAGVFLLMGNRDEAEEPVGAESPTGYQYEANIVLDDPETLQQKVNEMLEKVGEGQMSIEMQTESYSDDGQLFSCYLANALENSYDMFVVITEDATQEEVYRSGLIPLGGRIETFQTKSKLGEGTHVCTVTYVQVEDDHSTIHAQVNIGLNLVVR